MVILALHRTREGRYGGFERILLRDIAYYWRAVAGCELGRGQSMLKIVIELGAYQNLPQRSCRT